jgi:hypothetical protein
MPDWLGRFENWVVLVRNLNTFLARRSKFAALMFYRRGGYFVLGGAEICIIK